MPLDVVTLPENHWSSLLKQISKFIEARSSLKIDITKYIEFQKNKEKRIGFDEWEKMLKLPIIIYGKEDGQKNHVVLYQSKSVGKKVMRLFYDSETGFKIYKRKIPAECPKCRRVFAEFKYLNLHIKRVACSPKICKDYSKKSFPCDEANGLFVGLASVGITVPDSLRQLDTVFIYDIETKFVPLYQKAGQKTVYSNELEALSYSLCTNLPQLQDVSPFFFYSLDPDEVFEHFWMMVHRWSHTAFHHNRKQFIPVFQKISQKMKQARRLLCGVPVKGRDRPREYLNKLIFLRKRLEEFIMQTPVIGFASSKFDLAVFRKGLVKKISEDSSITTVCKGRSFMLVAGKFFRFLDFQLFCGQSFSLDAVIKLFASSGVLHFGEGKLKFPFSLLREDDLKQRLSEPEFPPHSAFFNELSQTNIDPEEYQQLAVMYYSLPEPRNLLSWLKVYNCADVEPLMRAVLNYKQLFQEFLGAKNIYREYLTLPSVARDLLSSHKETGAIISLPDSPEVARLIDASIVGGCAIITHRVALREGTFPDMKLPDHYYNVPSVGKLGSVVSIDSSQLYSACLALKETGVGIPCLFRKSGEDLGGLDQMFGGEFVHKNFNRTEHLVVSYFEMVQRRAGICVDHRYITEFSGTQICIGPGRTCPDGFCYNCRMLIQYHSCGPFHSHAGCVLSKEHFETEAGQETVRRDQRTERVWAEAGFTVLVIRECEWNMMKTSPEVREFQHKWFRKPFYRKQVSGQEILKAVIEGDFFGLVEVDCHVPRFLRPFYDKWPCLYQKRNIGREDLSAPMLAEALKMNLLARPQELLIPSLTAQKITVSTELLNFYLSRGFQITRIYAAISWIPGKPFKVLGKKLTEARINAARDPNLAGAQAIVKLAMNSMFGATLIDPTKFTSMKMIPEKKLSRAIRNPKLKNVVMIESNGVEYFEVEMLPNKCVMKYPKSIGAFLLCEAKLRISEMAYHILDCCQGVLLAGGDTDNIIVLLSSTDYSLDSNVREDKKKFWEQKREHFFPLNDSVEEFYKPSTFKTEAKAQNFIGISAKSYILFDIDQEKVIKYSMKGAKRYAGGSQLTARNYINALEGRPMEVENRGFQRTDEGMLQYTTLKTVASRCYFKRKCGRIIENGETDFSSTSSFF